MRAVASAAMVALVVLALLAGNCLSCPQMLSAMSTHQPSHGCCHHGKNQTQNSDCTTQSLRQFVKVEGAGHSVPVVVAAEIAAPLSATLLMEFVSSVPLAEYMPPPQTSLRI